MTTIFDLPSLCPTDRNHEQESGIPDLDPGLARSRSPRIPTLAEPQIARHYTRLYRMNYGVDDGLYPLGSCTMKYNPKLHEQLVGMPEFASVHPGTPPDLAQGTLAALHRMSELLAGIAGMSAVTLQPSAGAHGELTGMFLIKRFFESRAENGRDTIILTDSAHGTNPASAALAGFKVLELTSLPDGTVDLDALSSALDDHTAGIMLTVPNTLGLFEPRIGDITARVHEAGGLCYFDGANLNSYIGRARPGDMGADIFHFNLHKT
ncbi:aminotransferase class V-fold PLP-dependent enzyme, partial [Candidatus Bipolaricaulota bacterium]|nr:aminotransferase class V-fold PLP-dependent enzyme [Candidatus Bipolaricaulota bacterium]